MKQKKFTHTQWEHNWTLLREDGTNGRVYVTPEGYRMPSVTTVLGWQKKDSLKEWRKRVGEEEANRISTLAARRGTKVHSVCELYLNNEPLTESIDAITMDMFKSIQPLIDARIDDIYAIELPMYSKHLGVAGTTDCIAKFDGKTSIIDFKTSSKLKKEEWIDDYFMQTACYAVMFEERTGIPVSQLVIIIAVENNVPQIFIQKRDVWIGKAIEVINLYTQHHMLNR